MGRSFTTATQRLTPAIVKINDEISQSVSVYTFLSHTSYFCFTCVSMGDLGAQVSVCPFVSLFVPVFTSTLAFTLKDVYKLLNLTVSFPLLIYLTKLNKDDISHSAGAYFHILERRCDKLH